MLLPGLRSEKVETRICCFGVIAAGELPDGNDAHGGKGQEVGAVLEGDMGARHRLPNISCRGCP